MTLRNILLLVIILGVFVNFLANLIWNYLPEEKVYPGTYLIATITTIIVCAVVLIFGSEGSAKGFLAGVWKPDFLTRLWEKITSQKKITFILDTAGGTHEHWNNAELHGEPAMSIHSLWHVTNLTSADIWILKAYLEETKTDGIIEFPDRRYLIDADTSISPEQPTKISVDFCIRPPTCKEGEIFKGKIVFIDHLNKQHKVKVAFKPPVQFVEVEDYEPSFRKSRLRAEYSDLFSDTDTWLLEACKCLEVAHKLFEKLCVTEEDKVLLKEFSDRIGILEGQRDILKWKRQGLAMGDWDGFRGNKRV